MVRDMNEKGRVGWFVRGRRKSRGCHSQKSLRAPLVSLASFSLSLSLTFSLARISAVAVSKLFLRPVIKGWPAPPRANREIITRSITFRTDIFLPSESI